MLRMTAITLATLFALSACGTMDNMMGKKDDAAMMKEKEMKEKEMKMKADEDKMKEDAMKKAK